MNTVAYSSPFVPVEWIAAHGLQPQRLRLGAASGRRLLTATRGVCPYAGALLEAALGGLDASALVLTTICDQMRYAAALLENRGRGPLFLLNVPSTWQTAAARTLYVDELRRLGRFLVQLGGRAPLAADLAKVMLASERARRAITAARGRLSARQFAVAAAEDLIDGSAASLRKSPAFASRGEPRHAMPGPFGITGNTAGLERDAIPLAILGGPLLEADYALLDLLERCGGRVALDATEGSQRTMPASFDPQRLASDPLQALADAYFDGIADPFRRPNSGFYQWLGRELTARQVRGIIFRRYLWCDLWHAELQRVKQFSPVPVLEIDAGPDDAAAANRTQGRIEAFLEMLSTATAIP